MKHVLVLALILGIMYLVCSHNKEGAIFGDEKMGDGTDYHEFEECEQNEICKEDEKDFECISKIQGCNRKTYTQKSNNAFKHAEIKGKDKRGIKSLMWQKKRKDRPSMAILLDYQKTLIKNSLEKD